jgi:predicted N-acetyltransferase YhbS
LAKYHVYRYQACLRVVSDFAYHSGWWVGDERTVTTMAIQIRPLREEDSDSVDPMLRAAYGVSFSRSAEVRRNLAIQPDGWLLAEQAGQPVGMVGVTNYGSFAYVGLMAVDPAAQRQGIGRLLMQALLAKHYPTLHLDATDAGAPLYRKVGFVDDSEAFVYERTETVVSTSHANVRQMQQQDLVAVTAFDTPIFGADRSRVLRQLLTELPGRAFVARDDNHHVTGFLFAQLASFGPWVAATPEVATALLDTALATIPIERPRVLVASDQHVAQQILAQRGFRMQRKLVHMRRGEGERPGIAACRYGLTSFALG